MKVNKEFNREEFERHLIKDDDITLTSCCNRKYYKTKKNFKCPGCKKLVTKDIVGRGIMKGINQMMIERDKEELKKESERAEESKQDTFDSWLVDLEEKEQPETCDIDDEDCEACGS
jgi:hypothetical protein